MDLRDYLAASELSHSEFAGSIGVSVAALYRYLTGERLPKKSVMDRIIAETSGKVQPNDFYKPQIPDHGRAPTDADAA